MFSIRKGLRICKGHSHKRGPSEIGKFLYFSNWTISRAHALFFFSNLDSIVEAGHLLAELAQVGF